MSRIVDLNGFIEKAKTKFKDKFDYSLTEYNGCETELTITCLKHGPFKTIPRCFFQSSYGCQTCASEAKSEVMSLDTETFIKNARARHGDKYDYSKSIYVNSFTKVIVTCPTHGDWLVSPAGHINSGNECPVCSHAIPRFKPTQKNTEQFIKEAKEKRGEELFSYEKVNYVNAKVKVDIFCKKEGHGFFSVTPDNFLRKRGCPKCKIIGYKKISNKEEFVKKAVSIHGNRYNYDNYIYVNCDTKGTILCKKHGFFEQAPSIHLSGFGCGCPNCGNETRDKKATYTTEYFINQAKLVHGNKYDYSRVNYINYFHKVEIGCPIHGWFFQVPSSHLKGIECLRCSCDRMFDINDFIKKANAIHNNKYDYSKFIYIDNSTKGIIICPIHGEFHQAPIRHVMGSQCDSCLNEKNRYTTEEFIEKAKMVHGDLYDYSKILYSHSDKKVEIVCRKHGSFFQQTSMHLAGQGCPACVNRISKPEVKFLDYIGLPNAQEYRQVKLFKRFRVDGYNPETKTAYEFLGDFYHGNPKKFNFNDMNEICQKSYGELYLNTMDRFQLLKNAGYEIRYIWEADWNKFEKDPSTPPNIITF